MSVRIAELHYKKKYLYNISFDEDQIYLYENVSEFNCGFLMEYFKSPFKKSQINDVRFIVQSPKKIWLLHDGHPYPYVIIGRKCPIFERVYWRLKEVFMDKNVDLFKCAHFYKSREVQ